VLSWKRSTASRWRLVERRCLSVSVTSCSSIKTDKWIELVVGREVSEFEYEFERRWNPTILGKSKIRQIYRLVYIGLRLAVRCIKLCLCGKFTPTSEYDRFETQNPNLTEADFSWHHHVLVFGRETSSNLQCESKKFSPKSFLAIFFQRQRILK